VPRSVGTIAAVTPLSPVQRRTLDLLSRRGDPVVFDAGFVGELRADFDTGLGELADRLGDGAAGRPELFVTKHGVAGVLTCEASWAAPDSFTWTAARARGQVAHRAIQLSLHWRGEIAPAELVDAAIERLADEERGLGDWLTRIDALDRADLRSRAVEHVTKFLECFPPLDPRWRPVTEGTSQYPPAGPIMLRAKVDLTLGPPRGDESTKVILDLKTGRVLPRHRDDLRFYALIETLARRLPPRLLATYSLDAGTADTETVTEGLLRSTLRRTLDAIERMVEVRTGERPPTRTTGPQCRWCSVRSGCADGQAWLAADDPDGDTEPGPG
jgi:PD-(D/E)XK nuclease superfamily